MSADASCEQSPAIRTGGRRFASRGCAGSSRVVVLTVLATTTTVGGATAFFVAHPEGRRLFGSFLRFAAGRDAAPERSGAPPAPSAGGPETEGRLPPAPPGPPPAEDEPRKAPITVSIEKPPEPRPQEGPARREALEHLARARRSLAANDLDGAESAARAALARDSSVAEEVNALLGSIAASRAQAAAAKKSAAHDAALESAREFLAKGEFEKAREWAEKALATVPESPAALAALNDIARAKEKRDAELAERRARADSLAREGTQALAAGDCARALQLAGEALELDPGNAAATLLRSQAERERKRAEEALAAKSSPTHVELEPREGDKAPAAKGATEDAEPRAPITIEVPQPAAREKEPEPPPAQPAPIVIEDVTAPPVPPPAREPVTVDVPASTGARPQPTAADASPGPVHVETGSETPEKAPLTVELAKTAPEGDIPLEVQAAVIVLAQLDKAMEREDVAAFERLLSEGYSGGTQGARTGRAEELENVRGFFEVASGIRVERTTYEKDIRADPLRAEARSYFRVSYAIGQTRLSRAYRALYRLARERGQWRIAGVTIEEEGP